MTPIVTIDLTEYLELTNLKVSSDTDETLMSKTIIAMLISKMDPNRIRACFNFLKDMGILLEVRGNTFEYGVTKPEDIFYKRIETP